MHTLVWNTKLAGDLCGDCNGDLDGEIAITGDLPFSCSVYHCVEYKVSCGFWWRF